MKLISKIFLVLALMISASFANGSQIQAASPIQIKIDGVVIPSDANPEMKNERVMVPLRTISETLGASVEWSKPQVTVTKNNVRIVLRTDSNTVMIDGESEPIDAIPYLQNNRVMVPLRFLAEAFGSKVHYANSTVTIDTEPLVIDGTEVKALQLEYRMTMGGMVYQTESNVYKTALYDAFTNHKGEETEAPVNYSWIPNIDVPGSYQKSVQYDFVNTEGTSIQRFEMYILIRALPEELLKGYQEVLLYDATENIWYKFSENAKQSIADIVDAAERNGYVTMISNTAV